MGSRGPIGRDNVTRLRRGNPGRRAAAEPLKAPPCAPDPPDGLTDEALAEWERVVPDLDALGILSVLDRAVLTRYCLAWAQWLELRRILDREGLVLTSERYGARKHPAWQMYREAGTMLDQAAASCGLSPAARQRMARPAVPPDDDNGILD